MLLGRGRGGQGDADHAAPFLGAVFHGLVLGIKQIQRRLHAGAEGRGITVAGEAGLRGGDGAIHAPLDRLAGPLHFLHEHLVRGFIGHELGVNLVQRRGVGGPAQGVHDPIFVRSFAIEGNGGGLVMSIVDLPGMGNEITREVRKQVAAKTGLSEAQILVGTTHSHSAPDFMGLWGGVPGGYRDFLVATVTKSMSAAWATRAPGILKVATDKAPANNRRGWGFTDDDMTVLDAFDLESQRIGTVIVFAAHPVVLGEDPPGTVSDPMAGTTGCVVSPLDEVIRTRFAKLGGYRVFLCGDAGLVNALRKQVFLQGCSRREILADPFVMAAPTKNS